MANRTCKGCIHYRPYDGGLDVNDNGDVIGGSDADRGQCLGMEATIDVKCTDVCPHWKGQMSHRQPLEKARLEAAVVEAALAERRAGRYLRSPSYVYPGYPATEKAWHTAMDAYEQAVDALLAFLGEEQNA